MFSASLGITWVASKSLQFWYVTEIFRRKKERVKCNLLLTKCPDDIDEKGNCISASPLVQVICNKKEVECSYFCCPLKLFLFCICLQFAQLMASALLFIILYSLLPSPFILWLDCCGPLGLPSYGIDFYCVHFIAIPQVGLMHTHSEDSYAYSILSMYVDCSSLQNRKYDTSTWLQPIFPKLQ